MNRDPVGFKDFQHPDMRKPTRSASAEHKGNPGRLTLRLNSFLLYAGCDAKQNNDK
jgi:hypothetical protein